MTDVHGSYIWPPTKPGYQAEIECFYNKNIVYKAYKQCNDKDETFEETDFGSCQAMVSDKILLIIEEAKKIDSIDSQREVSGKMKAISQKYSTIMNAEDINNTAEILDLVINYNARDERLDEQVQSNVMKILDNVHKSTSPEELASKDASRNMRNVTEILTNRISSELDSSKSIYLKENTLAVGIVPFKGKTSTLFSISGDKNNLTNSQFDIYGNEKALFSAKVPGYANRALTVVIYNSNSFYPEVETVNDVTLAVAKQFYNQGKMTNSVWKVVPLIVDINYANSPDRIDFKNGKFIELNFTQDNIRPRLPQKIALTSEYKCAFYNVKTRIWVTGRESGCITSVMVESEATKRVTCKCSHMTSFAVLMSFHSDYNRLEGTVTSILLKSSLGCLILTILAYLPAKEMLRTRPVRIKLLLVSSLIFSIIFFLSMEHLTSLDEEKDEDTPFQKPIASLSCTTVAFLMNYFWLCQMAWMVCEALVMYRTLVSDVFNSHISKYMLKFNLACWGIPLIFPIIGIIWGQSNFANPETCFLRKQYGLVTFYTPVTLSILFNSFIFIRLSWSIFWFKNKNENEGLPTREENKIGKQFKFAVTVMTMFGVGWLLGFFLIIEGINTIWLRWLFIICNSSQGMIIFYLYVLQSKDLVKIWKERLIISRSSSSIQPSSTDQQAIQSTTTALKTKKLDGSRWKKGAQQSHESTKSVKDRKYTAKATIVIVSEVSQSRSIQLRSSVLRTPLGGLDETDW